MSTPLRPVAALQGALAVIAGMAAYAVAWSLVARIHSYDSAGPAALVVASVVAVLTFVERRRRPAPGTALHWDGHAWHLCLPHGSEPGELALMLDATHWMLVRFRPASPPGGRRAVFLALSRAAAPEAWHAVRCAVYSPRRVDPAGATGRHATRDHRSPTATNDRS